MAASLEMDESGTGDVHVTPRQPSRSKPFSHWPNLLAIYLVTAMCIFACGLAWTPINRIHQGANLRGSNFSRQWGGLAILSLTPFACALINRRIAGGIGSVNTILAPSLCFHWVMKIGADRSWLACVGFALFCSALGLAFEIVASLLMRMAMRRGKPSVVGVKSPMWDADADRPLAAKGPL